MTPDPPWHLFLTSGSWGQDEISLWCWPLSVAAATFDKALGKDPGSRFLGKALRTIGFVASPWPSGLTSPFIKHSHCLVLCHLMVLGSLWSSFPQLRCLAPAHTPQPPTTKAACYLAGISPSETSCHGTWGGRSIFGHMNVSLD